MQFSIIRFCNIFQESHSPRPNGEHMSMEARDRESLNGDRLDKPGSSGVGKAPTDRPPSRSGSSSSRSTPSLKTKDVSCSCLTSESYAESIDYLKI